MKRLLLAGMMVLGAGTLASAAPLNPEHVSAEAKWVVHVDFDAARETTAAKRFQDERIEHPDMQAGLAWVEARYGIDPRKDLHGLSMYGTTYDAHTGVAILLAKFDREKVEAVVTEQPDYQSTAHGDYTLHSWTLQNRQIEDGQKIAAAFHGEHATVFARTVDEVKAALDVMDGKEPGIDRESPLILETPEGTVLHGAAIELAGLEGREGFAVLQQSERATLAMGEKEDEVFATGQLVTKTAEMAQQVQAMFEGFRAMLALQAQRAPEPAEKLVERLKVEVDDKTMTVEWRADSEDLMKLAEEMRKRQEEGRAPRDGTN